MNSPTPSRKARTIFCAVVLVVIFLWVGAEVVVMSGTKSTFSFVAIKSPPGGGLASSSTTTTTAKRMPSPATTPPGTGGR